MKKTISIIISILLSIQSSAIAQFNLPEPGKMLSLTQGFNPAIIKGLKVFANDPLRFDFIVDAGDADLQGQDLKEESQKLIKYFLASLTVPEEDLWVNLNPKEPNRIIPEKFGETEMGRDLLAQDYLLKQLTASLMYPEDKIGRKFWDKIYAKLYAEYGHTNVPVNTFNKVWIMPDKAVVFENGNRAFVVESSLKVMLEEDYFADKDNVEVSDTETKKVIREVLLPEIEKEVNQGKHFTQLRQIYNSLILATWFKRNLKKSLLGQVYVNKNKVVGVDIEDKDEKKRIYERYLKAFEEGVYDYVKEEKDLGTNEELPRRYFGGGVSVGRFVDKAMVILSNKPLRFGDLQALYRVATSVVSIEGPLNIDNNEIGHFIQKKKELEAFTQKVLSMMCDNNFSNFLSTLDAQLYQIIGGRRKYESFNVSMFYKSKHKVDLLLQVLMNCMIEETAVEDENYNKVDVKLSSIKDKYINYMHFVSSEIIKDKIKNILKINKENSGIFLEKDIESLSLHKDEDIALFKYNEIYYCIQGSHRLSAFIALYNEGVIEDLSIPIFFSDIDLEKAKDLEVVRFFYFLNTREGGIDFKGVETIVKQYKANGNSFIDNAMTKKNPKTGGISLNPNEINLNIKGNSVDFSQLSNSAYIKSIKNSLGLRPTIINIKPITLTGIKAFLGI